jgi:chaperonin GroES
MMNMNEMLGNEGEAQSADINLRQLVESKNIAETIDEQKLTQIGSDCAKGFEYDLSTRSEWENNLKDWTKLALQVREEKSWPWPKAANVKYPLLSTAAMQFNARAYPSLIPSNGDVVKVNVIGKDRDGMKLERAKRIGMFMSYQVLYEMHCWEEDMDKLLMMLPIIGTVFKKTYYNPVIKQNVSELVLPENLVVNYWAKSLESAERVSEIIPLSKRLVKEKMMSKTYLDVELGDPIPDPTQMTQAVAQDEATPYQIIEQHTYLDLDEDGYAEPYVVTFERTSGKVLRIVARFDEDTIYTNEDGDLQRIEPIQYYTKFGFIPNPDGGFYDVGFGLLLGPLNESVNTLINQLIDAGTLSNLQGGFLGKGLKLKMGESRWQPGEWKPVNSTADDLRKQIVPLPAKEPSNVLFQLMGSLITSGKELASVAEIFVGKMPGQNTPATTTMATIEQGMKVFTAVYKRVYRALRSEFKKIYDLNRVYLDPNKYAAVIDTEVGPDDFDKESYDVCPAADPSTPTGTEKLMKAQGLLELLPTGILDPVEVIRRVLEAQEQPNYERLFNQQIQQTGQMQPPPDPKLQEMEMKGQLEQQKIALQAQEKERAAMLAERSQAVQLAMKTQEHNLKMQADAQKAKLSAAEAIHKQRIFSVTEQAKVNQQLVHKEQAHRQSMAQQQEKAKLQASAATKTSVTGGNKKSPKR